MGAVFEARDLLVAEQEDPDPYVAIKILHPDLQQDRIAVMALQREANRVFKLAHPGIVRVKGFERDRDTKLYFIVMELLEGHTLQTVMREHPVGQPWEEVSPYLGQMCDALDYAHSDGELVHSDIKPSNLFITTRGQVKILDFGIAAPIEPGDDDTEPRTRLDTRKLGARTPEYASLDMFLGFKPHGSDDVYSLAVVTYQWLAGRHPYESGSPPEVFDAPKALEQGLRPAPLQGLTRWQNSALRRALALQRAERTQTVREFYEEMTEQPPIWQSAFAWTIGAVLAVALAAATVMFWRPTQPTLVAAPPHGPASVQSSGTPGPTEVSASSPAASPASDSTPLSTTVAAPTGSSSSVASASSSPASPLSPTPSQPSGPPPAAASSTPHVSAISVTMVEKICQGNASVETVKAAFNKGFAAQMNLSQHPEGSPAYQSAMNGLREARRCLRVLRQAGLSTSFSERFENEQQIRFGELPDTP
jgi:serine/threonine protein kinase